MAASAMSRGVRARLGAMMFLQYFVWGAWYVTAATYLGGTLRFSGAQIGQLYGTTALAAMISPFFVGVVADRLFANQRLLALLHLVGAGLVLWASTLTTFGSLYPVLMAYTLCYMPTMALCNAIAFHQMQDPGAEFPGVRVFGTVGWIAAGVVVGFARWEATALPFKLAAGASLVMAGFSWLLPHTPPPRRGTRVALRDILGLDALALMRTHSFAVFVVGSFLVCIPLQFYYTFTNMFLNELGVANAASKMALGQGSEILFMVVMPFFFARLGVKKMLLVAMLAWAVRYVLFALGDSGGALWMFYGAILLHGVCYDFFFVTGQIYVDQQAPLTVRASAQGFITFVTYGVGMYLGASISGAVVDGARTATGHAWRQVWLVPAAGAGVVMLLFLFAFQARTAKPAG